MKKKVKAIKTAQRKAAEGDVVLHKGEPRYHNDCGSGEDPFFFIGSGSTKNTDPNPTLIQSKKELLVR